MGNHVDTIYREHIVLDGEDICFGFKENNQDDEKDNEFEKNIWSVKKIKRYWLSTGNRKR